MSKPQDQWWGLGFNKLTTPWCSPALPKKRQVV
jgi:hypothetical protein